MKRILFAIRRFLSERFTLTEDKADEKEIIESIKAEVQFKGTNVWTLIFAIFIASIGLNMNSTAVIIGAMLISPLMGPIMGVGLAIAINDLDLLKKGAKNLVVAATISMATSFLYFTITPLHEASSELLARTNPSIWDVFIAFLGGLAGIVAGTRKKKSNVIPGVAIATALMPPLCTAGFGLASGKVFYFLGALYLFFINSLFICLATFLIVKRLRFHKVEFTTPENEKRVSRLIFILVIITVIPSIYLAYRIVQRSIFESNAKSFVRNEFHFARTQVVAPEYVYDGGQPRIELLLVGQPLPDTLVVTLRKKMPQYGLDNAKLVIHQGLDAKQKIDLSEIKASVLEEVYAQQHIDTQIHTLQRNNELPDLRQELHALFPTITRYSLGRSVQLHVADSVRNDTIMLFTAHFSHPLPIRDRHRLAIWLQQRIHADTVRVMFE